MRVYRTLRLGYRGGIRIEVLSPAACRRRGGGHLFGLELDPALYRSIIVHEVAHLVARFNGEDALRDVAGQEYIAFTVQLGTLPEPLLERVLSRYDQPAFARETEITALLHALSPEVFAVKAWRHFRQPRPWRRLLPVPAEPSARPAARALAACTIQSAARTPSSSGVAGAAGRPLSVASRSRAPALAHCRMRKPPSASSTRAVQLSTQSPQLR